MNTTQIASVIIFVFTIVFVATERIHRLYSSFLGAMAMVLVGAVKAEELLHLIDIEILGVIVGMMLIVVGAEKSGVFNLMAKRIMKASKSPMIFGAILMSFTMILSILLNNIGAMLISATITILMSKALKFKPERFLIFQAIIANLGGMMLLMSSIPNIIVAVEGGLSFSSFITKVTPIGAILFILTTLIFLMMFRAEMEDTVEHELRLMEFSEWVDLSTKGFGPVGFGWRQIVASVIVAITVVGFAVYDRLGLTPDVIALSGGFMMLIFSGESPQGSLREIDWSTVLFLACLFVMVNGMDKVGLIEMLSIRMLGLVRNWPLEMPISVMWLSAIPSGIIDNIPLTATFAPMISHWITEGTSTDVWWGLVLGANLGGCLTPIGSPSSIIALGVAEREGHPIPLGMFFVICFGVTMVNLLVSTLYLYLI